MGRARVALPPGAFLQATAAGEAALAALVLEHCGKAAAVADLFAGVGPFALRLAERARVTAVDSDKDAIAALKRAAETTQGLKPVAARGARPVSPAAGGRRAEAVRLPSCSIRRARAPRRRRARSPRQRVPVVVAVSCNPATFARDARILVDGGYRLDARHAGRPVPATRRMSRSWRGWSGDALNSPQRSRHICSPMVQETRGCLRLHGHDARRGRELGDLEDQLGADRLLELRALAHRNHEGAGPADHAILEIDVEIVDIHAEAVGPVEHQRQAVDGDAGRHQVVALRHDQRTRNCWARRRTRRPRGAGRGSPTPRTAAWRTSARRRSRCARRGGTARARSRRRTRRRFPARRSAATAR